MSSEVFERKFKIAKYIRFTGIGMVIIQLMIWLHVFDFAYSSYLSVMIIFVFSVYILLVILNPQNGYGRKRSG
jgi:uncharacterized protein (DUF983 family)